MSSSYRSSFKHSWPSVGFSSRIDFDCKDAGFLHTNVLSLVASWFKCVELFTKLSRYVDYVKNTLITYRIQNSFSLWKMPHSFKGVVFLSRRHFSFKDVWLQKTVSSLLSTPSMQYFVQTSWIYTLSKAQYDSQESHVACFSNCQVSFKDAGFPWNQQDSFCLSNLKHSRAEVQLSRAELILNLKIWT